MTASPSFSELVYGRADNYFHSRPAGRFATGIYFIKASLLLIAYATCYTWFIFYSDTFREILLPAVLLGMLHVLIPVNISHDAIHQSVSKTDWLNKLAAYGFEITGSSSYMYARKHLEAHRNKESGSKTLAIESQGLLLKSGKEKKNLPVLFYLFYSQYMIYFRDYILFSKERNIKSGQIIQLILFKCFYFFLFVVLPFLLIPLPWWQVVLALLLMYLIVTVFLVIILLMPTEKMENSRTTTNQTVNDRWLIEILEHNVDFSPKNRMINLLGGGANLNVVHYLFPSACHVHYNKLAEIISQTAAECGITYRSQVVSDVFAIHFNYLKNIQSSNS